MVNTLFVGSAFSIVSALVYFFVGLRVRARATKETDSQLAISLFSVWWMGLGAVTLVGGLQTIAASFGLRDLGLWLALTYLNLLVLCLALWGLLYYLLYLFTGKSGILLPLTIFYVAYYAVLVWFVWASGPVGVKFGPWSATLEYAHQVTGPTVTVVIVLLLFPQILGALAYFAVYFKTKQPEQRYRVALVSWSIVIWFMASFLASVSGLNTATWWQIVSRSIGLAAALTILAAYQPPAWVRRKWARKAPANS